MLKTRNMTRTHVNRALLHILLGIRKEDPASAARLPGTIHMLGMGSCGKLLSSIKEKGSISLCSTPSVIRDGSYENDLFASNLYETVKALKSGMPFIHEFERRLLRI